MERNRHVDGLLSIFDLGDYRGFGLPEGMSTRVMFLYDEKKNIKEFRMLDRDMPIDMNRKITSWLEDNLDISDLLYGLERRR